MHVSPAGERALLRAGAKARIEAVARFTPRDGHAVTVHQSFVLHR
jgi:hypothetical protein